MKALVITLILLIGLGAKAGEGSEIQTAVDSQTGEALYACNARIKHLASNQEQECFDLSSGEICHPGRVKPGDAACVCRTKTNQGDQVTATTDGERFQTAVAGSEWVHLVDVEESFGNKLTKLDISLGSENLGAEYAVTFCYAGPHERLKEKTSPEQQSEDLSEGKYRVDISLAGLNYGHSLERASFAYVCDHRNWGNLGQPRGATEVAPPTGVLERDNAAETIFFEANSSAQPDFIRFVKEELYLNQTGTEVPRFCIFEFKFKERSGPNYKREPKAATGNFSGKIRVCKQSDCP